MKRNNDSNDSLDQALANTGLINRFKKILDSDRMDEWTADAMIEFITEWKNGYTERALKRLDEEIARMQEMRELALKKLENEKKSRE
jgi:murein L,D-transpeptidase YafK